MATNTTDAELWATALAVIETLRRVPNSKYRNLRIAVIGGLVRMAYVPEGRVSKDVDFLVEASGMAIPPDIKKDLAKHGSFSYDPNSPDHICYHQYTTPEAEEMKRQVDFFPSPFAPYLPSAAQRIRHIQVGNVPYISRKDFVLFKIYVCNTWGRADKREEDATEARDVLETVDGPIFLTKRQQELVRWEIDAAMRQCPETPRLWWARKLGLLKEGDLKEGEEEGDMESGYVEEGKVEVKKEGKEEGEDKSEGEEEGEEQDGMELGYVREDDAGEDSAEEGREEDIEEDGRELRGGNAVVGNRDEDPTRRYRFLRLCLFGFVLLEIGVGSTAGAVH